MRHIGITGGAGFIGVNTATHFLAQGDRVTIYDNLSRRGSQKNLAWLVKTYPRVRICKSDLDDASALSKFIRGNDIIFHFAAQVAVTTSVVDPVSDFRINALGTLHVLEEARKMKHPPIILYTSTNKVYGSLESLRVKETATRYVLSDCPHGISESQPLDFHSPYGCSKGCADQYVHDYARIYDMPTVVFRQSCIYGPHQYGVEDQGWVAWFFLAAFAGKPITIYGNGKQVRDILYIDDLVDAYERAIVAIKKTKGEIFNIGGGNENSISIWKEFAPIIQRYHKKKLHVRYAHERPGDQKIFIADTRKFTRMTGWKPRTSVMAGIDRLVSFLRAA